MTGQKQQLNRWRELTTHCQPHRYITVNPLSVLLRSSTASKLTLGHRQQQSFDMGFPSVRCEYHKLIKKLAWPDEVEQS